LLDSLLQEKWSCIGGLKIKMSSSSSNMKSSKTQWIKKGSAWIKKSPEVVQDVEGGVKMEESSTSSKPDVHSKREIEKGVEGGVRIEEPSTSSKPDVPREKDEISNSSSNMKINDSINGNDITKGKLLGRGGFADVFSGEWKEQGVSEHVALKCFFTSDHELSTEIEEEVRLHLSLSHPHILECYGTTHLDGDICMVLELSTDGTIDQWIYKKKLCSPENVGHVDQVLKWFKQCAAGLKYLHSQLRPIIHRDFKPQNLLLFQGGRVVKIADMGVSRIATIQSMTEYTGTQFYISPEVLMSSHYDEKADVFSFAISLLEVLTCKKPYSDNEDIKSNRYLFMLAIQNGMRPGPHILQPKDVMNLITSCWKEDSEQRPKITEVVDILESIIESRKNQGQDDRLLKIGIDVEDIGKKIQKWMIQMQPKETKFIEVTERIFDAVSRATGIDQNNIPAIIFVGLGRAMIKYNNKRVDNLLEYLKMTKDQLLDGLEDGFSDFDSCLDILKVIETDTIFAEAKGLRKISAVCKDIVKQRNNLYEWAKKFIPDLPMFKQGFKDFDKSNVESYLKTVFRLRCSDSLDSMYKAFRCVLYVRCMYTLIITTFYNYAPESIIKVDMDPVENIIAEIEAIGLVISDICKGANKALSGFFMASLTSDPSWAKNLALRFIPDTNDIPKTAESFWKETFMDELIDSSCKSGLKVKVYKQEGSRFISYHDPFDHGWIFNLQEDETLQDGIFRKNWGDGSSFIGSMYHRRSGRDKERMYYLYIYTLHMSKVIEYHDIIWGKDDRFWRDLVKYRFNQETLVWGKI